MRGAVVRGRRRDVTHHVGGVLGGAEDPGGVACGLQRPPVGVRGQAVVGGQVGRRGQVGGRGRGFVLQVEHGRRGEGLLLRVQQRRAGGGAGGRRGGAFQRGGGACGAEQTELTEAWFLQMFLQMFLCSRNQRRNICEWLELPTVSNLVKYM